MAKENDFNYLNLHTPSGESEYSIIRWGWGGIDRRDVIDSGKLSDANGVLVESPSIVSAPRVYDFGYQYSEPIGVTTNADKIMVMYRSGGSVKGDYFPNMPNGTKYIGVISDAYGDDRDFAKRTVTQFNVATNTDNIIESTFDRKLLIFPDKASMDLYQTGAFQTDSLGNVFPDLRLGAVWGSRLFGIDDNLVYASSYNDYANWNLDTADESSTANAWVSMSQSNVKADGKFTAIYPYDNHVVLFKQDFMQLVYNNKNPFRIVDVGEYGCVSQYALTESNGILYFVAPDGIYAYGGGTPKKIDSALGIDKYTDAALGAWNGRLYANIGDTTYSYKNGEWSIVDVGTEILQFASPEYGLIALTKDGRLLMLDGNADFFLQYQEDSNPSVYGDEWWFETDFMLAGRLDTRRVKKVSMLCDAKANSQLKVYLLKDGEKFSENSRLVFDKTFDEQHIFRCLVGGMSGYMHRLRVCGKGQIRIYAAELKISFGGDIYIDS